MSSVALALAPISEADVRQTYFCEGNFQVDDGRTQTELQVLTSTMDGTKVTCSIRFQTPGGIPILDTDLERWFCGSKRLLGRSGRSKVAFRVKFYIRSNFQGQGLATYILDKEEALFRAWGAAEIQVTAMDDGRWVWTRSKFGYSIRREDFRFFQQRYLEWQRERGIAQPNHAVNLADFPKEFLLSATSSLSLFKSLEHD